MSLRELLSTALIGTRTGGARLPALPQAVSEVLPASDQAETALLDAAAALTVYERAGVQPQSGISRPEVCPPDDWPECSSRAGEILAEALQGGLQPVLIEWLRLAAACRRRAPHALLPQLLDAAAARRSLQEAVAVVIDRRGRWLMQFNARWQFAGKLDEPPHDTWQLGNRVQRGEALRAMRLSDPAKAREWVSATWRDDGADERTDWVAALQINLSNQDESLLESCLDDRSSRVREAAANLLARLPTSHFVQRMTQRLDALVTFRPGSSGSLLKLKRGTKSSLEIVLPAAFEKAMQRDGVGEKPPQGIGPKQWWMQQLVGYVPLSYWTRRFAASPAELVDAAPAEYSQLLLRGWLASLSRAPLLEWIQPLVVAAAKEVTLEQPMLTAIPEEQRAEFLRNVFESGKRHPSELPALLDAWSPLDPDVSQLILDGYGVSAVLSCAGHAHLHPAVFGEIEAQIAKWTQTPGYGSSSDRVLSLVTLRRDLHKEFAT